MTDKTGHGNARDFQKLRESLSIHALLGAWTSYERPLHSSFWNRTVRVRNWSCAKPFTRRVAIVAVVVGVKVVRVELWLSCATGGVESAHSELKKPVKRRRRRSGCSDSASEARRDHGEEDFRERVVAFLSVK